MPKRLTPLQAADRLGVCRDTIYEYIKAGHLPAKRRGPGKRAAILIEQADLEAFLRPVVPPLEVEDTGEGLQHVDLS